jgi:hypothetical protein
MKLGNTKRFSGLLKIAILATAVSFTLAWQTPSGQEEDDPRGIYPIFKRTRKKSPVRPSPPPKNPSLPQPELPDLNRIGIGYSLYKCTDKKEDRCEDRNKLVRVDINKEVQTGDLARFVIEPNIDGFLYIFNAVNDGEPKMIFPHHRLRGGDNKINAHVPYEVPSRELGWFRFVDKPEYAAFSKVTENLFIIVTRKPLPGFPTGSQLFDFCQSLQSGERCTWKPTRDQFNLVQAEAGESKMATSRKEIGKPQTSVESEAVEQERDLEYSAPEPSLIVMNVSAKQNVLVLKTQLVHRRKD